MEEQVQRELVETRKARRMTQQEYADALGVTRVNVANWESGQYTPGVGTLRSWSMSPVQWIANLAGRLVTIMFPPSEAVRE